MGRSSVSCTREASGVVTIDERRSPSSEPPGELHPSPGRGTLVNAKPPARHATEATDAERVRAVPARVEFLRRIPARARQGVYVDGSWDRRASEDLTLGARGRVHP